MTNVIYVVAFSGILTHSAFPQLSGNAVFDVRVLPWVKHAHGRPTQSG
jgi:hypothetical protein